MATVEKIIKWGVAYSLWTFSPENAGMAGQVLTKTATGYAYQDIAEPNVIAMTQTEYDALPEATKTDGKLRIITDATGIEMADKAYVDGLVGDVETLLAAL